ncbi:MAG: hypothetical protein ACE5G5_11070 [Candidatus Methylomirabilales bacterium]
MMVVDVIDLVKRGYFCPETALLRVWRSGLDEDDPLEELVLTQELLLSRN